MLRDVFDLEKSTEAAIDTALVKVGVGHLIVEVNKVADVTSLTCANCTAGR